MTTMNTQEQQPPVRGSGRTVYPYSREAQVTERLQQYIDKPVESEYDIAVFELFSLIQEIVNNLDADEAEEVMSRIDHNLKYEKPKFSFRFNVSNTGTEDKYLLTVEFEDKYHSVPCTIRMARD